MQKSRRLPSSSINLMWLKVAQRVRARCQPKFRAYRRKQLGGNMTETWQKLDENLAEKIHARPASDPAAHDSYWYARMLMFS